jgi:hypothetical protein
LLVVEIISRIGCQDQLCSCTMMQRMSHGTQYGDNHVCILQ